MSQSLPTNPTPDFNQLKEQANQAHQASDHTQAAKLYLELYNLQPNSFNASRYLGHKRKQGHKAALEALPFAEEAHTKFPDDIWVTRELIWTLYDCYLKDTSWEQKETNDFFEEDGVNSDSENTKQLPTDNAEELTQAVSAARRILDLTSEDFQRAIVIFAVCKKARKVRNWQLVYEFIQLLERQNLATEAETSVKRTNGQPLPSHYQQWLYNMIPTLAELKRVPESIALAEEGIIKFPDDQFFPQWLLQIQARQAEASEDFAEAANRYRQLYDLQPNPFNTAKLIHAMRKQGTATAREAIRFIKAKVSKDSLDNNYLRNEYVWTLYDAYLKVHVEVEDDAEDEDSLAEDDAPDVETPADFSTKLTAARSILKHTSENLPRKLAVFAICKAIKLQQNKSAAKWQQILDFAEQLDPKSLSTESKIIDGIKTISDYERWLFLVTKASFELEDYEKCAIYAKDGIEKFPHKVFFPWWLALTKVRGGELEGGLRELEQINVRYPQQWFIQRDIAECYIELNKYEEAWLWLCKAANAPGDLKGRINMLSSMANVLQQLGKWEQVYDHLQLAWAVAAGQGTLWQRLAEKKKAQLLDFLDTYANELPPALQDKIEAEDVTNTPPHLKEVQTRCRREWQRAISDSRPHLTGSITNFFEGRDFGFIQTEKERIYFKVKDYRSREKLQNGLQVEFEVEKSFDQKKNQDSTRAINIRAAKAQKFQQ